MTGSHLIDCPSSLADAIAAGEIEVLDDVHHAHSHPNTLISRLLLDENVDTAV